MHTRMGDQASSQYVLFQVRGEEASSVDSKYFKTDGMAKSEIDDKIQSILSFYNANDVDVEVRIGDRLDYLVDNSQATFINITNEQLPNLNEDS